MIENTRAREREIELQLSDFTTKGGQPSPVVGRLVEPTSFTIAPCGEHEAVVVVSVGVPGTPDGQGKATTSELSGQELAELSKAELVTVAERAGVEVTTSMTKSDLRAAIEEVDPSLLGRRFETGEIDREVVLRPLRDVDDCHVAIADLRVQGCDTRPIRLAVAVLPRDCGPYPIRCACRCC